MSANFNPSLRGFNAQEPFRFWCQKVLPLVYDDSLSYYELLNKVVNYLNNVITDLNNMGYNIEALNESYKLLQGYVNTYFDNLDITKEINDKIDEMAISGELTKILGVHEYPKVMNFVSGVKWGSPNNGSSNFTLVTNANTVASAQPVNCSLKPTFRIKSDIGCNIQMWGVAALGDSEITNKWYCLGNTTNPDVEKVFLANGGTFDIAIGRATNPNEYVNSYLVCFTVVPNVYSPDVEFTAEYISQHVTVTQDMSLLTDYFDSSEGEEVLDKSMTKATTKLWNENIDHVVQQNLPAAVAEADLSTPVNAWLTEHVTPVGSAVTVDDSLTLSGSAADSKTAGYKCNASSLLGTVPLTGNNLYEGSGGTGTTVTELPSDKMYFSKYFTGEESSICWCAYEVAPNYNALPDAVAANARFTIYMYFDVEEGNTSRVTVYLSSSTSVASAQTTARGYITPTRSGVYAIEMVGRNYHVEKPNYTHVVLAVDIGYGKGTDIHFGCLMCANEYWANFESESLSSCMIEACYLGEYKAVYDGSNVATSTMVGRNRIQGYNDTITASSGIRAVGRSLTSQYNNKKALDVDEQSFVTMFISLENNEETTLSIQLTDNISWSSHHNVAWSNTFTINRTGLYIIPVTGMTKTSDNDYFYIYLQGVTNDDNVISYTLLNNSDYYTWFAEKVSDAIGEDYDYEIVFWGDSLTEGLGGEGTTYPGVCCDILGVTNYLNAGVRGETAQTIACRQGGDSWIIPAGQVRGRTYTPEEMLDVYGYQIKPLRYGNGTVPLLDGRLVDPTVNNIKINGVSCTLNPVQTGQGIPTGYTITNYNGGALVAETPCEFGGVKLKNKVDVYFAGQNGPKAKPYPDDPHDTDGIIDWLIRLNKDMVKKGSDKWLVIGRPTGNGNWSGSGGRGQEEYAMLKAFGNRFLNARYMLSTYGMDIEELTPTEDDTAAMAIGAIPPSLRVSEDDLHLNAYGYHALGVIVANKLRSLGYFE